MPGVDVVSNTVFLVQEMRHYMSVFGVNRQRVDRYSLNNFDYSLLKCTPLLEPHMDMIFFVGAKLGTYATLLLVTSFLDLIFPLVRSIISSATAAGMTYIFLDNILQEIKDDAVLIYELTMTTNADHRMQTLTVTLTVALNTITYKPYHTYSIIIWFIHVLV